ncbi:MAG: enoyl-CoA hydratase/isomerase family protein, partial [Sphingomonadales bacterium]
MSKDIEVSREGHVGLIEICRPPHNYFTIKLIREIGDALKALDADKEIRAVVLAARGNSFCAGADLKDDGANLLVRVERLERIADLADQLDREIIVRRAANFDQA